MTCGHVWVLIEYANTGKSSKTEQGSIWICEKCGERRGNEKHKDIQWTSARRLRK